VSRGPGLVLIGGLSLVLAACSSGETSRPGFPRTELTPIQESPFPYAAPEDVGMSEQRLWLFKERLYSRVVARHLVGSEILVIKDGRIVLHQAMGWADIDRAVPMDRNSVFRIASMTKPFVGTATLMLVDEGLMEAKAYNQLATYEAGLLVARSEGFIPAPETNHALACVVDLARQAKEEGKEKVILCNFSGHGVIDLGAYEQFLAGNLSDYEHATEEIEEAEKILEQYPKPEHVKSR